MPERLITEPVLTWNLFLTAFLVPACLLLLAGWMKRQFEKRDEKEDRITMLLNEREAKKEEAIMEWRQRFQSTLCGVKEKVDEISEGLHERVHYKVCDDKEKEFKRTIEEHDRRMRDGGL